MSFRSSDGNFESNNFMDENFMTWGPIPKYEIGDMKIVKKIDLGDMKIVKKIDLGDMTLGDN